MKLFSAVFFVFAVTGIFAVSCSKNDSVPVEEVVQVEVEAPLPVETFLVGKILSKNASLCLFGRDSVMHPVIKLSGGSDVSILEIDGVIDLKSVPGKAEGDAEVKYVHAVHENMDFWIETSVFALNCENAVAIEKTFLYSDSALSQKIDSPQNPMKFSALLAKANDEESLENPGAVKVYYYDNALKSVQEAFVSSSSISTRKDDIVVSQIAEELKVTKRAVPRNELFARAAKYKPCQKVLAVLNEQKEEKKTYNYQEVLKSMQRMSFGVNVDELMTVDQSKDPFK